MNDGARNICVVFRTPWFTCVITCHDEWLCSREYYSVAVIIGHDLLAWWIVTVNDGAQNTCVSVHNYDCLAQSKTVKYQNVPFVGVSAWASTLLTPLSRVPVLFGRVHLLCFWPIMAQCRWLERTKLSLVPVTIALSAIPAKLVDNSTFVLNCVWTICSFARPLLYISFHVEQPTWPRSG